MAAEHTSRKCKNQFAYKITGRTTGTGVLVHFVHRVTKMLEHNAYVRCLMIGFYRAKKLC